MIHEDIVKLRHQVQVRARSGPGQVVRSQVRSQDRSKD